MGYYLVIVVGNLGAGKTALVERLGDRLGWHIMAESVADNPYLADFYADKRRWSFHLQIHFLAHRASQHITFATLGRSAIMDRSVYEDAHVFAKALHHLGNITDREYATYLQAFHLVVNMLPSPDLLVYLTAPTDVLINRIQGRGLEFDNSSINREYLQTVDSFYKEWVQTSDICPVLTIDTEHLDYVNDEASLEFVINAILDRLDLKASHGP